MNNLLATALVIAGSSLIFVHQALCQGGGCAVPTLDGQAMNMSVYRQRSSALMIFTDAYIPCDGYLVSFNFVSRVAQVNGLHFSIWRKTTTGDYTVVADSFINLFAASTLTWNSYTLPTPTLVKANDVIGIFYENWLTNEPNAPIPYTDRFTAFPYEAKLLKFYRTYVALVNASELYNTKKAVITLADVAADMRLPAFQAVVSPDPSIPVSTLPPPTITPTDGSQRCASPVTPDTFTCNTPTRRAVYNKDTGMCQEINGCLPTSPLANNFANVDDCSYWCGGRISPTTPPPSGSTLPPKCLNKPVRDVDFNNCGLTKTTRFYYNTASASCVGFLGCANPNAASNNFGTMDACRQLCLGADVGTTTPSQSNRCVVKPIRGTDFGACGIVSPNNRYYFTNTTNKCVAFQGCVNYNGNNFDTDADCMRTCTGSAPVTLPPATPFPTPSPIDRCAMKPLSGVDFGTCPGGAKNVARYFYNVNSGGCNSFLGCINPNVANNFATQTDCERACGVVPTPSPPTPPTTRPPAPVTTPATSPAVAYRCSVNPIRGYDFGACPGNNSLLRYYWSRATLTCVGFQGCRNVSGNNWDSERECRDNCGGGSAQVSTAAPAATGLTPARCANNPINGTDFGNCVGKSMTVWYFSKTKACVPFNGCSRNDGNNFPSRPACASFCNGFAESVRIARCRRDPADQLYDTCETTQRAAGRVWFDVATQTCTTFLYNVCVVADGNNFDNVEDCQFHCRALMGSR